MATNTYPRSGWADNTLPNLSQDLDPLTPEQQEAFKAWLKGGVSHYRAKEELEKTPFSQEIKEVDSLIQSIEKLKPLLEHNNMPPIADAQLKYTAHKAGKQWRTESNQLIEQLDQALTFAKKAKAQLDEDYDHHFKGKRLSPNRHRDFLIYHTYSKLTDMGLSTRKARTITINILTSLGVNVSTAQDEDDVDRSIRRIIKAISDGDS